MLSIISKRKIYALEISVFSPETDNLPLLTRLLLFAAYSNNSLTDVCTVSMIDEEIVRSEADRLAHMGIIACGLSGQLRTEPRGRRLWDDFMSVRNYRNSQHRIVFDPLAQAVKWLCPPDSLHVNEERATLLPHSYRMELAKAPVEILANLIGEVSPGLAEMIAGREDASVDVSLGPATGTLTSPLPLPLAGMMLPHPHTAVDPGIWNYVGSQQAPLPSQACSIEGPALRFHVTVGREGRRDNDTIIYLFDLVTGVIYKEEDVAKYMQLGPVEQVSPSAFQLPPRHTEADLYEALASGLLASLLPERGSRCRAAGWSVREETVTIRRGATEAVMVECAIRQAEVEGGWRFLRGRTDAPDCVRDA